jgi:hypothetical protein
MLVLFAACCPANGEKGIENIAMPEKETDEARQVEDTFKKLYGLVYSLGQSIGNCRDPRADDLHSRQRAIERALEARGFARLIASVRGEHNHRFRNMALVGCQPTPEANLRAFEAYDRAMSELERFVEGEQASPIVPSSATLASRTEFKEAYRSALWTMKSLRWCSEHWQRSDELAIEEARLSALEERARALGLHQEMRLAADENAQQLALMRLDNQCRSGFEKAAESHAANVARVETVLGAPALAETSLRPATNERGGSPPRQAGEHQ